MKGDLKLKRSELNLIMKEAVEFIKEMSFELPPFAYWEPEEWEEKGTEYNEIKDNMLGWDITDFGSGDYYSIGLLMFTLRNGNFNLDKYKKTYAEKLLIVEENQITPFHFHWSKMEDIINRGGGELLVTVYNSTDEEELADTDVLISKDGKNYKAPAGTTVKLKPGESITLYPEVYHKFWAEKGKLLVGEVSTANDDRVDNRFLNIEGRFPEIEEDEEALYLLANEYPNFNTNND